MIYKVLNKIINFKYFANKQKGVYMKTMMNTLGNTPLVLVDEINGNKIAPNACKICLLSTLILSGRVNIAFIPILAHIMTE